MNSELIQKLDDFVRKYYKNLLVRGSIMSGGMLVVLVLIILLAQYFGQFSTTFRTVLFYAFLSASSLVFVFFILLPLLRMYRLGKVISYEDAAVIIGKHFPEVSDKLLNVLQLQSSGKTLPGISVELLEAGIIQKSKELKPIPFSRAIDISLNRRLLPLLLLPLLLVFSVYLIKPTVLTDSAEKIIRHSTHFELPSPFVWKILNNNLSTIQHQDFQLQVHVSADAIPEHLFIELNQNRYSLRKAEDGTYTYLFVNPGQDVDFTFFADGFYSKPYRLKVYPEPSILSFSVNAKYAAYIQKKDETIKNNGEITCPAGTILTWTFETSFTEKLMLFQDGKPINLAAGENGKFTFTKRALSTFSYALLAGNSNAVQTDTLRYSVQVIPDNFPLIHASQVPDSLQTGDLMYLLDTEDDYGFTSCRFVYTLTDEKGTIAKQASLNIPVSRTSKKDMLPFACNIATLGIKKGQQIKYFFEIADNDAVNGPKKSKTEEFVLKTKTEEQLQASALKNNEQTRGALRKNIDRAKQIEKELNELNKKIQEKKILSFDEIKRMKELLDKQKMLEKEVQQMKDENMKMMNEQLQFSQNDENLLDKQKQIEKLFNEVVPPELKEKMKELEKMLQEMNKEKMQEALDDLKKDTKDIEKELDRTLSLFKQMEFEEKLKKNLTELEKLADDQKKLSDESANKTKPASELKKEQDKLSEKFSEFKEDMKDLGKKAEELEMEQKDMFGEKMQEKEQDIQNDQKESSEKLGENKSGKASESQSKAAQKMKQMAAQMKAMAAEMEASEAEEDLKSLRVILENLLRLSFDQEDLMKRLTATDRTNPQYVKLTKEQKKIEEDAGIIEDSLFALSKRQPKIESLVNREIASIKSNMEKAIKSMADRNIPEAASRQQYVMTAVNNLALMLSEAFEQMQQDMASSKPGSGKCKKPGGSGQGKSSKPSVGQMKKMQEQVNRQIEKLKSEMEKEKAGNGKKPAKEYGKQAAGQMGEGQNTSEQLARMAAQQEAIRRELQKAADQLKKEGKDPSGNLRNLADMMDKTETDLVNKNITRETLRRQQEIMNRLLEAENAERERELDEKRTSSAPKNEIFSNPDRFLAYKTQKMKESELLKTIPPNLQPFYKNKVNKYYNTLNK